MTWSSWSCDAASGEANKAWNDWAKLAEDSLVWMLSGCEAATACSSTELGSISATALLASSSRQMILVYKAAHIPIINRIVEHWNLYQYCMDISTVQLMHVSYTKGARDPECSGRAGDTSRPNPQTFYPAGSESMMSRLLDEIFTHLVLHSRTVFR